MGIMQWTVPTTKYNTHILGAYFATGRNCKTRYIRTDN